ncbi:hypothetical protein DFH07DRAFT_33412 [Mycena maculata]|uniref:Uncharacterized protein n=1 Tax=Mycena maculata TaxID=230809 RepID=A0AAD7IIJ9_9AGAR|nr:hypothetical protein DFH07DRAFT_33412 [Mycena maculata]
MHETTLDLLDLRQHTPTLGFPLETVLTFQSPRTTVPAHLKLTCVAFLSREWMHYVSAPTFGVYSSSGALTSSQDRCFTTMLQQLTATSTIAVVSGHSEILIITPWRPKKVTCPQEPSFDIDTSCLIAAARSRWAIVDFYLGKRVDVVQTLKAMSPRSRVHPSFAEAAETHARTQFSATSVLHETRKSAGLRFPRRVSIRDPLLVLTPFLLTVAADPSYLP